MENKEYIPDPKEFDHVDDFIDDTADWDDFDEDEEEGSCGGCIPGPEEFD